MLALLDIQSSKYYSWQNRRHLDTQHNGHIPKLHWLLDWEIKEIIKYRHSHMDEGYRRLTYMMLDENIVAVSPSSVYRVLKRYNLLLTAWRHEKTKGSGFHQPTKPHQHWHIDISYITFHGSHLFLISVLDGFSRFIVHHELRTNMQEYDVEIVLQRALEKYPNEKPRIISDNGSQFIANDFKAFLRSENLTHVRTSVNHPQSNGKIEAFHKNIKHECIRQRSLLDLEDARTTVAAYIHEYNHLRLHSGINYIAPYDMLHGNAERILKERDIKLEKARRRRQDNAKTRLVTQAV